MEKKDVVALRVNACGLKFVTKAALTSCVEDLIVSIRKTHASLIESGIQADRLSERIWIATRGYLLPFGQQLDGLLENGDEITLITDPSAILSSPSTSHSFATTKRVPSPYSLEETKLRIELAATYRIFAKLGWNDIIYNHLTVRLPKEEEGIGDGKDSFLINPFGMLFSEVTASSLIKVDIDGNILDQGSTKCPINKAGYVIHSAVHANFPNAHCVMHSHEDNSVAVSNMKCGFISNLDQNSMIVGEVAYHDYEGIALRNEEKERLVKNLGDKKIMILRNHGILTCGETIAEAFIWMHYLIKACSIQVKSLAGGIENLSFPSKESYTETRKIIEENSSIPTNKMGQADLAAMIRVLEAEDDSFADLQLPSL